VLAGGTTYGPGSHLTAGDILTYASASPARDMGGGVPRCRSLYLLDDQGGLIIKLQEARFNEEDRVFQRAEEGPRRSRTGVSPAPLL
jgi:hypothetical protein